MKFQLRVTTLEARENPTGILSDAIINALTPPFVGPVSPPPFIGPPCPPPASGPFVGPPSQSDLYLLAPPLLVPSDGFHLGPTELNPPLLGAPFVPYLEPNTSGGLIPIGPIGI